MAIAESIAGLVASFIATVQTRAELVAVEVEEEALRYFTYLLLALTAMFCVGVALLLAILLVVAIYWDTHRIEVLLALIIGFAGVGLFIAWKILDRYRHKPHLLEHTINELSKDIDTLKASQQ
jgi:uncharacterized membrane protein YqjE